MNTERMSDNSNSMPQAEVFPGRRTFLGWLTYGLGAIGAAAVGIPFIGYWFGARRAPVDWVRLGLVDEFPENETRLVTFDNPLRKSWDGMVAHTGVYVRYEGKDTAEAGGHKFLVLAVNCAHLGCPVTWFPQSGLFMCPCHGGVYYEDGERASGPPTRGLFHCAWRVRDGQLEVQAPHLPTLQHTLDGPSNA